MNEQEYNDFALKRFNETRREIKPVDLVLNQKCDDYVEKAFTQGVGFMQVDNDGSTKVFDMNEIYKAPEGAKD